MSRNSYAPSEADLRQFLLGTLPEEKEAVVAAWVENAPEAASILRGLAVQDSLTSAVQSAHGIVLSAMVENTGGLLDSESVLLTDSTETGSIPTGTPVVEVGGTLAGYRLLQKLGEGGMGSVFIAEDVALRRKVALKVMKPEIAAKESSKQRFFREARAAARLEHDNIVTIHQVGEDGGVPFLAMALLKGESLGDYLKREPQPALPFLFKIGRDVAEGLGAAHEHGLIHRDIKPDNIWIEPLPKNAGVRAKILDFGLARPQEEDQSLLTQEGAILGTPAYMAPEQARGGAVDHRADLFSLGVVLYQMSTGQRPFTGANTMAVLSSLALDTPPEPIALNASLPPIFSKLVMKLLEKDPAKRAQSAGDVADVLKRLQPDNTVIMVMPLPLEANPWQGIDDSVTDVIAPTELPKIEAELLPVSPKRQQGSKSPPSLARRANPVLIVAALVLLLGGSFAVYKLFFQSKDGTLVVEVDGDADLRFKKGKLEIYGEDGKLKYTLEPSEKNKSLPRGKYLVKIVGADGLKVDAPEFVIEKNGKTGVRISVERIAVAKKDPPTVDYAPSG